MASHDGDHDDERTTPPTPGEIHDVRSWAIALRRWPPDAPPVGQARRVSGATGEELGRVYTLEADLSFADDALEQLLERWNDRKPPADIVLLALWHAALVAYARCFGPGRRRPPLSSDVVPSEALVTHQQSLDLRSWVIAHPMSDLEVHSAGVEVGVGGNVGATRVMRAIPGLPSREFVERLRALVHHVGSVVFAREQALHAELATQARAMTAEQRMGLPILGVEVRPGQHGQTRRGESGRGRKHRA